jgi:hypothetical protein
VTTDEVLVVDYEPDAGTSPYPVLATASPRVQVLRASSADLATIASRARLAVAGASDGRVEKIGDDEVLGELDDGARLFVEAWMTPPRGDRERPGDGQPWDAPGFEPPDPPPGQGNPAR